MIRDLITANRSYRRFDESVRISQNQLLDWIDLARLTGSAGNGQRLKFAAVSDSDLCAAIFPTLAWAGYLTDWPGPAVGERPTGYIIILRDKSFGDNFVQIDEGLAAQSALLGAVEAGFGGCMIASVKRAELADVLKLDPNQFEIALVIALGKPIEKIVLEPIKDGDIKYWRDAAGVHHVPKRSLKEIVVEGAPTP